jgi:hypothetical protein
MMQLTKHANKRIQERGIPKVLLELVIEYGEIYGDAYKLNKKHTDTLIEELKKKQKLLEKISKKGGLTVIPGSSGYITAYRINSYNHKKLFC